MRRFFRAPQTVGNPISTTGTMSGSLGRINPFRYRGYYYDVETGYYYLQARYYNPSIGRFISADPVLDTNSTVGLNLYAYCGNDPVNRVDYHGRSWEEIADFFDIVIENIFQAIKGVSPVFAGCAGGTVLDGPLPFADIACVAVAGSVLCGAVIYGVVQAVQTPPKPIAKAKVKEKSDVIATPKQKPTVIYRYGGTNPGNLTPREKDQYTGLSFSTIPLPGAAMTTIEAINATGIVYAIQDSATHVSIRPVGATMKDWIAAGSNSIWTQAVKSVVVKFIEEY